MGSCSTGRATAVDNRTRSVTRGGRHELTHGSRCAHVAVVGQGLVARRRVGGLPLDRNVGVFRDIERAEAVIVSKLCRRGRRDHRDRW